MSPSPRAGSTRPPPRPRSPPLGCSMPSTTRWSVRCRDKRWAPAWRSRGRRLVPAAGPGARCRQTRSVAPSHSAAHDRAGDVRADHGLPHPEGSGPAAGRAHARLDALGPLPVLRRHPAQGPIARPYFGRCQMTPRIRRQGTLVTFVLLVVLVASVVVATRTAAEAAETPRRGGILLAVIG